VEELWGSGSGMEVSEMIRSNRDDPNGARVQEWKYFNVQSIKRDDPKFKFKLILK
jgi:hypothetical protein